jgi:hypothetical protein
VPKVTDFGLAKRLDVDTARTQSGAVLGTPSYMAPEQAAGKTKEVGPPADVYALGAILYECLTGRPPFKADTVLATLKQVAGDDPAPPRTLNPGVPRDLETVCLKCLQKEPRKRYASAGDLRDDLRRFLGGEPIRARPVSWAERAVKWVQRRPASAALLGAGAAALAGVVIVWALFTAQLKAGRDEAERQTAEVKKEKARADYERDEAKKQKKRADDERDLAKKEKKRADDERDEAKKQAARADHILGIAAGALDTFATSLRSAKQDELTTANTGLVLYKLACTYARASKALTEDKDLPLKDREKLVGQYARGAMKLLLCAEKAKFFEKPANRGLLKTDPDLSHLGSQPDFEALLSRMR